MQSIYTLYKRAKFSYQVLKLVSDTSSYGVGDEAFNPFNGKRMCWTEYESLRREYRMRVLEALSQGKLKRVNNHE